VYLTSSEDSVINALPFSLSLTTLENYSAKIHLYFSYFFESNFVTLQSLLLISYKDLTISSCTGVIHTTHAIPRVTQLVGLNWKKSRLFFTAAQRVTAISL
jgi:hypothetical protein